MSEDPADEFEVKARAFLVAFREFVVEVYGVRCVDAEPGCPCCDMWELYDRAAKIIDIEI